MQEKADLLEKNSKLAEDAMKTRIKELNRDADRAAARKEELERAADRAIESLTIVSGKLEKANELLEQNNKLVEMLKDQARELEKNKTDLENTIKIKTTNAAEIEERVQSIATTEGAMRKKVAEKSRGKMLEFEAWELAELKELNEVVNLLRNPVPLEKAIYELYYKNKLGTLTVGLDHPGIYRIWYERDGYEINYVGQSVNVKDRWAQHLKRMVGAEESTGIKLYSGARKVGLENLRWEELEACSKEELSEREKYWGEYYDVKNG